MQTVPLNPNLTSPATFSYKDILVKKLARAVACSLASQLTIILLYIILANINILSPTEWITSIFNTFTYVSTWIFIVIFSFIIFAQCLICAKDYVLMTSYCSTRFQQFLHIFSFHNFLLLALHVVIGGAFVWQILAVVDSSLRNLTATCADKTCLVQDTFFLIVSGFWMGFYFFLRVYISSKHLIFPVVQQKKFLQFRSNLPILFKESLTQAILPTFYFIIMYYLWGSYLESRFVSLFSLDKILSVSSLLIYVYCWWFASLYFFSMSLMRFFFYLFLTEPVQFPVIKENLYVLTLQEGIIMDNLPIIQNLACLDLFLLSQWSQLRRQLLFSLSQPGGHPHYWNNLIENILKLLTNYTDLLKKSTETPLPQIKTVTLCNQPPFTPIRLQSPTDPSLKFRNLRNMSCYNDYLDVVNVSHDVSSGINVETMKKNIQEAFNRTISVMKIFLGINFLFGELPKVNIQKCLGNGQLIIWASQGITELASISLTEDKYGIVQKDLPVILNTLVQLKQSLDKLNKVPVLVRKVGVLDDFNYKMKNAVTAAVRHSLFNLCLNFGDYFNDLPLSKDVLQYLHANVMLKNCN